VSRPAHLLLLGGSGKLDYVAKTLSSVALAMDRITSNFDIDASSVQTNAKKGMVQDDPIVETKDEGGAKEVKEEEVCCRIA